MQLRRIIGYLQKLLYTVKRIRMSLTPTLNIYLFEGPILLQNVFKICSPLHKIIIFLEYNPIFNLKTFELIHEGK
jgi:hypothetical protein